MMHIWREINRPNAIIVFHFMVSLFKNCFFDCQKFDLLCRKRLIKFRKNKLSYVMDIEFANYWYLCWRLLNNKRSLRLCWQTNFDSGSMLSSSVILLKKEMIEQRCVLLQS